MRRVPLIPFLLLAFAVPAAAQEAMQEEAPPPMMVMSSFQCDWNRFFEIGPEMELRVPIWEELVAEGMIQSAGSFFHSWADQWNVSTYLIGDSMEDLVAANAEAGSRFAERHPDATVFGEACGRHRDNFYQFGPVADAEGAPTGGNPTLAIAYWECDFGALGDIIGQYESNAIPVLNEMVAEGKLRGAGSFGHIWADEWNLAFYWVAEDIAGFIDAWQEAGQRINAANPDAPNLVFENCSAHRDGIYNLGPRTGMGDDEDAEDGGEN